MRPLENLSKGVWLTLRLLVNLLSHREVIQCFTQHSWHVTCWTMRNIKGQSRSHCYSETIVGHSTNIIVGYTILVSHLPTWRKASLSMLTSTLSPLIYYYSNRQYEKLCQPYWTSCFRPRSLYQHHLHLVEVLCWSVTQKPRWIVFLFFWER